MNTEQPTNSSSSEIQELKEQVASLTKIIEQMMQNPNGNNHASTSQPPPQSHAPLPPVHLQEAVEVEHEEEEELRKQKALEEKIAQRFEVIQEKLRQVKGVDSYNAVDFEDLCFCPDLKLPYKFKCPDFEKYDGTGCPLSHLKLYCGMMSQYGKNEKLLVQLFQRSLMGSALKWFSNLDHGRIRTWKDLANAFLTQYKFNSEIVPDRYDLMRMIKKKEETVREYAHRWRERAAQVQPPMTEPEMITVFISTLGQPYYTHLVGQTATSFAGLIQVADRIEDGIRSGKIIDYSAGQGLTSQHEIMHKKGVNGSRRYEGKKEAEPEVHQILNQQPFNINVGMTKGSAEEAAAKYQARRNRVFTPLPHRPSELLPKLLQGGYLAQKQPHPNSSQSPNYNPNVTCDYHMGYPGHTTDACWPLKHTIQDLIDNGTIVLNNIQPQPTPVSGINQNPLPDHNKTSTSGGVNMVSTDDVADKMKYPHGSAVW